MNLVGRPDLIDRLSAAYALGTLRGRARRRFETLARSSPEVRVAALVWQERFMSITELQPSEAPDANVWKRIENLLAAETLPRKSAAARRIADDLRHRVNRLWQAGALVASLAALIGVGVTLQLRSDMQQRRAELASLQLQQRQLTQQNEQLAAALRLQPDVRYVSVLTDDQARPAMLVTFDPTRRMLTVKRVGSYQEAPDKSLQLWGVPTEGTPRSLGVLLPQAVVQLPLPQQATRMPVLAISLEPKGGVAGEHGPTGPVLWKGALLQTPV